MSVSTRSRLAPAPQIDPNDPSKRVVTVNIPYKPRPWQAEMHKAMKRFNVLVIHRGAGKAIGLDTIIPTPAGYTTMGDVRPGDMVIDRDGNPCRVKALSGIMHGRDCYEVVFNTGERVVCDGEHLWTTNLFISPEHSFETVVTTQQIAGTLGLEHHVIAHGSIAKDRSIVAVNPVPSVPVQCIEVDSPSHTYCVTKSFIPTHNSVLCMNHITRKALSGPPHAEYVYLLPLRNQAQRNVWWPLKRLLDHIPGCQFNNVSLEAILPNGAKILVLGADDPEKLRGLHLHGVILDEYSDMHPNTWRAVRPMLTNHQGWVVWIGTPKGHNAFWQKYQQSQEPNRPDWFGTLLPWYKTNALPPKEVEQMQSEMLPEEFEQEMCCFPPGALVATHNDVVPIEKLAVGDLVVTHKGRLQSVTATLQRHYTGDLVVIHAWGSKPIKMTPNHPVWICDPPSQTYRWVPACDVKADDWVVIPKKAPGRPIIPAALAELIAWYVSEGSICNNVLTISLGAHETTFVQRVCDCLTELGRTSRLFTRDNCTRVISCDATLCDFLSANCGRKAGNKRLPISLIGGHERLVFDTLIDGDGCIKYGEGYTPRTYYLYGTISEVLVQQVQLLAASLNLGGTYTTKPAHQATIMGRLVECAESYLLQVSGARLFFDKRADTKIRCAKNGILNRVRAVETTPYSGTVYNLTVAEDESYTVNNRAVHNCNFASAFVGSYYGKHLSQLREAGRITAEPLYRDDLEVYTSWDLGIRDKMAVWFFQLVKDDIVFIDYEAHSNYGFAEWSEILQQKTRNYGYRYAVHIAPHDIKNRELGSGVSRLESALDYGILFETCPKQDVMDGIELVRKNFHRYRFQSMMCEDGLESLEMYRAKTDKLGNGLGPLHDDSSHGCDSLRYGITHVTQVLQQPAFTRLPMLRMRR